MTAITKTINYVQNTPVSLGFSNPLTAGASTILTVTVSSLSTGAYRMGYFKSDVTTGVTTTYQTQSYDDVLASVMTLTGTTADLNACMNAAYFQPHLYEADLVEQDYLSEHRALPEDRKGEFQIQIPPDTVHGLSVGSACSFSGQPSGSIKARYIVTAIDSTNSATRIWMIYRSDYGIIDTYYNSAYKYPAVGSFLQTDVTYVNIAPVLDISYGNPHGNFTYTVVVRDGATTLSTDTVSFVGSFFIAEPIFATQPVASIDASLTEVTKSCNFGAVITQADNNNQSVQLLIKYYENDPTYCGTGSLQAIGDTIASKANGYNPMYISDKSMGIFGNTQVGTTISETPATGIVRWAFNGTPAECTEALSKVQYFRPAGITQDLKVETRIVNGKTRIYSSRGK